MKRKLSIEYAVIIFFFGLFCACRDESKPTVNTRAKISSKTTTYDTNSTQKIIHYLISYDSLRQMDSINNIAYESVPARDMLAWMLTNSKKSNQSDFTDPDKLFGTNYQLFYEQFTKIRFPLKIYQKIFPEEQAYRNVHKQHFDKGSKRSRTAGKVTHFYGTKITEDRKYAQLYSIFEKNNYLQLIFTAPAKYLPKLYLVTVSKDSLHLIDELLIYHAFQDAGDVNVTTAIFSQENGLLQITHIQNNAKTYEKIDTTISNFTIDAHGLIKKI